MTTEASAAKRRWAVAIAAGAAVTVLLGLLARAPRTPAPLPAAAKPKLILAPADTLRREETALRDPATLYLPTPWNSRPVPPPRDPGVAFASYPPEPRFALEGLGVQLPDEAPLRPADVLISHPPGNPLLGLGRTDTPVRALASRGAYVEIAAAGTGERVFSGVLAGAHPPDGGALWQPLEFIAAVDAKGLVGPLALAEPSNVDAINGYFDDYLTVTFRVGERLAPGFYRIWVGP
jgi:hypothetical protein